jgi:hypothetical protein
MSGQRGDWTGKDTAQCVGMLLLSAGALCATTGHLSIDDIRAYAHTAGTLVVPVVAGLGGTAMAVGLALLLLRSVRGALVTLVRAVWLYRRHWAAKMHDLGLTVTTEGCTRIPRLTSVVRVGNEDTLAVRMAKGQTPMTWHEHSAALAAEFGASDARIQLTAKPHRDIEIVLSRRPAPRREPMLALPAPVPHPLPLALPQGGRQRQAGPEYAIRLSGLRLQIVWARARRTGQNGSGARRPRGTRFGVRGEVRWASAWATI